MYAQIVNIKFYKNPLGSNLDKVDDHITKYSM